MATSSLTRHIDCEDYFNASMRITNLEQAIDSTNLAIPDKCTLFSDEKALSKAKRLKINVASLANNHIQDKGLDGISKTTEALKKNNIAYFGAGENNKAAKQPFWVDHKLCILGYCEHNKHYLRKVQVATENSPGVNPLTYENIIDDLSSLPEKAKAILYLHWGREHVALPDHHIITLTKRLLAHQKVLCIIGSHAHRIQGIIDHKGKKAYLCLGNFLFPNFYVEPPTNITYPTSIPNNTKTTYGYHFVGKLTYKKWRRLNRTSLLVFYNTQTNDVSHIPVIQHPNEPFVEELSGHRKATVHRRIQVLSWIYKLPAALYVPLQKTNVLVNKAQRYSYAFFFLLRQNGVVWTLKKTFGFFNR